MGVATGGCGGHVPPVQNSEGVPQKSRFAKKKFGIFTKTFGISNIFKIKWAKSQEKSEFGGRWF